MSDQRDKSIAAYVKLALAVIKQAIEDATRDIPEMCPVDADFDQTQKWKRNIFDRNQARMFLTTNNEGLEFWCRIAGLNMRTVLHYSKGAATDWVALGRLHRLHKPIPGRARATTPADLIDVAVQDIA